MVDKLHQADIGIILDFVPVHFAVDGYALANYDGTPLYEYPHQDVGQSEWGSCNFNHSRGEVRSFLRILCELLAGGVSYGRTAYGCHQQSDLLAGQ